MEIYNKQSDEVLAELSSGKEGLTSVDAGERLVRYGKNALKAEKKKPIIIMFLLQFCNVMTIILLIAAIISAVFSEWLESMIIFAVVLLNAIIGVAQEAKAEKAIEALQKLSSATAKVKRDGKIVTVDSEEITIGDVISLEAGDNIPCDLRLIECHSLKIEEAALTGESVASEKFIKAIETEVPLGDRKNMAYMGTNVIYGRGEGVAVALGMQTQMGKIASMLTSTKKEATPLEKKINGIGKMISIVIIIICAAIFAIKLLYNIGTGINSDIIFDGLLSAVSLAVAAIPEGLTAVITLVMTMGVTRMSKRNAIVRKLPAIETLGSAEIICSDKTGTITQNKMTVKEIFCLSDYAADIDKLVITGVLCNDSKIDGDKISGDPTETALIDFAKQRNYVYEDIIKNCPRVGEVPFDSVRKLMSTVNRESDGKYLYVKGAADELLNRCTGYLKDGKILPMTEEIREIILEKNKSMAEDALRVLGFAYRQKKNDEADFGDEKHLVFLGLMGMIDPVRPEVKEAVRRCFVAGITPIMITGDHPVTAIAIGRELGLIKSADEAMSGKDLDKLSDEEFDKVLDKYKVYARVSPENKVRIVKFWKARGKICAMTGDGVNDAPALKTANIGVGMGITGTDVTKNVADIVLADDNFATIVIAVEEGRKIYDNIKKTVQFLLSTNFCEVLTLLVATLCNFTILKPVQILWVNLVTDTIPALGLGVEAGEADLMTRRPLDPKKSIFAGKVGFKIIYQSILMAGLVLSAFFIGRIKSVEIGMTMAFAVLSLVQVIHAFNLKSLSGSIINKKLFKNKLLSWGGLIAAACTFALIYIPGLNTAFGLTALPAANLLIVLGLSLSVIPLVEFVKFFVRAYEKKRQLKLKKD